ncbi:hypothetical protein ACSBR2_006096 [Camellia fascicularis]
MSPWFQSAVTAQAPPDHRPPPPQHHLPLRRPSDSKSRSGTTSFCGLGILLWITVRFAGTISWISVLSAKPTKPVPQARNVSSLAMTVWSLNFFGAEFLWRNSEVQRKLVKTQSIQRNSEFLWRNSEVRRK